ncbi:peptide IlvX [Enterobacter hormaechei subsp. steigerwaltii]
MTSSKKFCFSRFMTGN